MALITYADKATMNENASVPAINKVRAEDMNEIKNVVNANFEYMKKKYKTLWTGSWSSGSITVPNSNEYHSFIVVSGNMAFACYKNSSGRVSGNGASAPGTSSRYDRIFAASTNGNVWTIEWSKELVHTANSNHGNFTNQPITEIIGLDPIIE